MVYLPLDQERNEIRVLEIFQPQIEGPGSSVLSLGCSSDYVRCKLKHVSLNDKRPASTSHDFQFHSKLSQKGTMTDFLSTDIGPREDVIEKNNPGFYYYHQVHATAGRPGSEACSDRHRTECCRYTWGDYEALSYMWGDRTPSRQMQLNDRIINVPQNLESALRVLRGLPETQKGMHYWIDALCINQDDKEERSRQVKRMKSIYSSARAVIVWLGAPKREDIKAIEFIHCINRTALQTPESSWLFLSQFDLESLIAVGSFFKNPYWERLWIIQELAVNHYSTIILCGTLSLTRRMIRVAAVFWQSHIEIIQQIVQVQTYGFCRINIMEEWSSAYRVHSLISLQSEAIDDNGLQHMLHLSRKAKAADDRDKVYGLLGLMTDEISSQINPNYDITENSTTIEDVYKNFARLIVETTGDLDGLFCWNELPMSTGWPSWVPDWRSQFNRHHIQYLRKRHASGFRTAEPRFLENNHLICKGFEVDRIDGLSYASSIHCPNAPGIVQPQFTSSRYATKSALLEAILRTLITDHPRRRDTHSKLWLPWLVGSEVVPAPMSCETSGTDEITHSGRLHFFQKKNEMMLICGRNFKQFFPPVLPMWSSEDFYKVRHNVRLTSVSLTGRRLMTSESGFIGLVPVAAQRGDVIVVFIGCHFPVVLRPCGESYIVVGECYVHGLMEGEVFNLERDRQCSLKEIVLS